MDMKIDKKDLNIVIHRFKCPAVVVRCKKWYKFGHFARMCRSMNRNNKKMSTQESRNISSDSSGNQNTIYLSTENEDLFVGSLEFKNDNRYMCSLQYNKDWLVNAKINNKNIIFLIDTGAKANCLSYDTFCQLNLSDDILENCYLNLISYNGTKIPIKGCCTLICQINNKYYNIKFIISDIICQSVLGAQTCTEIGIVKRMFSNTVNNINSNQFYDLQTLFNDYKNVFQGLGCLPYKCHLTVRPYVQPKIDAPRKIPFSLQDRLKDELNRMTKLGVIEPVSKPTNWVSSIVIVQKSNNRLRLCLDPRNLNEAIKRSHYPLPSIEDVRYKLNGAKIFSHLDAYSGF